MEMIWPRGMSARVGLIGSAVVVAVFLALLRVAAADADEIAYACEYDICTIDPDNPTTHANLTETESNADLQPAWSPDGSAISFTGHYEESRGHVYVTRPAVPGVATDLFGSGSGIEGGESTWSPDGTEVAFAASTIAEYNNLNIYVSPASGTSAPQAVVATSASEQEPAWSPDGTQIAYASTPGIYLAPAVPSATGHVLPGGVGVEPSWSPDGTLIAAAETNEPTHLRLIDANGDGNYVKEPEPTYGDPKAGWSPNSREVVYESRGSYPGVKCGSRRPTRSGPASRSTCRRASSSPTMSPSPRTARRWPSARRTRPTHMPVASTWHRRCLEPKRLR